MQKHSGPRRKASAFGRAGVYLKFIHSQFLCHQIVGQVWGRAINRKRETKNIEKITKHIYRQRWNRKYSIEKPNSVSQSPNVPMSPPKTVYTFLGFLSVCFSLGHNIKLIDREAWKMAQRTRWKVSNENGWSKGGWEIGSDRFDGAERVALQLYSRFCLREKCFTNWIDPKVKAESGEWKQKQLSGVKWKVDATTEAYLVVIKEHYFNMQNKSKEFPSAMKIILSCLANDNICIANFRIRYKNVEVNRGLNFLVYFSLLIDACL